MVLWGEGQLESLLLSRRLSWLPKAMSGTSEPLGIPTPMDADMASNSTGIHMTYVYKCINKTKNNTSFKQIKGMFFFKNKETILNHQKPRKVAENCNSLALMLRAHDSEEHTLLAHCTL